jgi:putative peptidoglycan lipid II flippase
MKDDSTGSIISSAKRFFSGTMLSRIAGMLRDMAMAFAFGTQESVAAFLVAFRFSHLLRRLLGEGALQSALIPQFEKLRQEDAQRAASFFRNLTASLSALLSLIVVVTMAALWGLLLWADLRPGNAEIVQLTLLMMPSLIFICLFGINASLLQCEKSFFTPSAAPVAFNLFWILGTFCLWNFVPKSAMLWLTLFVNLACMAQWAITLPQINRSLKELGGARGPLKMLSKDVLALLGPLSLGVVGVGAAQINNALDAVFARYADSEGPAYLWYAIRIQQLPLALFGIAISGAMLPPLSRAIKKGNLAQFREFLDFALRKSMALMVPITAGIFVLGASSINLIYGHGDFDQQATAGTTLCLWAYGAGLFPMAIVLILAPSFYAQNDYKTPTQASVLSIFVNLVLNFLMVAIFGLGAASVALATSISAWINLFMLSRKLESNSGYYLSSRFKLSFWKIGLASVLSAGIVLVFSSLALADFSFFLLLKGKEPIWPRGTFHQAAMLLSQTCIFFGSLYIFCFFLKADDLLQMHKSDLPISNV